MNAIAFAEDQLAQVQRHGEACYPEEGAGLLLGEEAGGARVVRALLPLANRREGEARRRRYQITALDMAEAEAEAERRGLLVLGVFHSHPDHPARPSETDREMALPWYSYVITSVRGGRAAESRSWRLLNDRSAFIEEVVADGVADTSRT